MDDSELYRRLIRFLRNSENTEDKDDRISSGSEEESFHRVLRELDRLSRQACQPDKNRIWNKIYGQVVFDRRRRIIRRWSMVAAVLLPVIVGATLFLQLRNREQTGFVPGEMLAEKPQVQLLLGDGRTIKMQEFSKDSVLDEKGAGIWIDTSHTIVYTSLKSEKQELVYNILQVPRSCEFRLVLSDGTQVWMNSESELRYPVDFVGKERRVFLKGEAYFQVAKNAEKPFRVEADEMMVEALGTAFDVNAYRDGGRLTATLTEGSVRVSAGHTGQECILVPGEQAQLASGKLSVAKVNVNDVIGWKEGRFVFSNMTLEEIAFQLERWYDVKIEFQDTMLRYYRFTGVMKRYNTLDQLIELIEETTNVKFQVRGGEVKICQP